MWAKEVVFKDTWHHKIMKRQSFAEVTTAERSGHLDSHVFDSITRPPIGGKGANTKKKKSKRK